LLKHVQLDPALAQTVATTVVNAQSLQTLAQDAASNAARMLREARPAPARRRR
jgi:hypothetical protein